MPYLCRICIGASSFKPPYRSHTVKSIFPPSQPHSGTLVLSNGCVCGCAVCLRFSRGASLTPTARHATEGFTRSHMLHIQCIPSINDTACMRTMAQFLVFGLRNPTRRLLCLKGHLATFFGMTKVLCTRFAAHDQKSPQYHHPQAPRVSEKVCV